MYKSHTPVKVLLLGSGGRELAIAQAIKRTTKFTNQLYFIGTHENVSLIDLCQDFIIANNDNEIG